MSISEPSQVSKTCQMLQDQWASGCIATLHCKQHKDIYLFFLTKAAWEHRFLQIQGFTVFLYQQWSDLQPVSHLHPSQADICRL